VTMHGNSSNVMHCVLFSPIIDFQ